MAHFLTTIIAAAILAVTADTCSAASSIWDSVEALGKAIELQQFCVKNPGHARCNEIEEKRAFCASNPTHDHCKEESASTLLIRCESKEPSNLGRCHAALWSFASDGAASLPEWQCVPRDVTKDAKQLQMLFIREAYRMPEVLHLPARQLVYYAVTKAFPCRSLWRKELNVEGLKPLPKQ